MHVADVVIVNTPVKLCPRAPTTASGLTTSQPERVHVPGMLAAVQVAGIVAAKLCPSAGYVPPVDVAVQRVQFRVPLPGVVHVGTVAPAAYNQLWASGLTGIAVFVSVSPQSVQVLVPVPVAAQVGALVTAQLPQVWVQIGSVVSLLQPIRASPIITASTIMAKVPILFFI
jgi:hypothetical protein